MGAWARYAGLRRGLVRRSFDAYRAVEQRVRPGLGAPPRSFGPGRAYAEVQVTDPLVALTFDDGPHPENTPRLLEILRDRGVRATFYLIGELAARHPEVARMTFDDGHEIGNHTWSHQFLTLQSTGSIVRELEQTHEAIVAAVGAPPVALRPPYGAITESLTRWVDHRFGYPTVTWSVDAADWEDPGSDLITERLVSGTDPGSIVLAHDPLTPTVDAMAETLDRLLERGIRFVTVSELISGENSG
ncbi:MAG: polysaccharide deacetylase family protein [Acidimicrobiia bacterium]